MNKAERAERLASRTGLSKSVAKEAVDGVFGAFGDALANGKEVLIVGFETFGTRSRPARAGCNPSTGEAVSISASTTPTFNLAKSIEMDLGVDRGGGDTAMSEIIAHSLHRQALIEEVLGGSVAKRMRTAALAGGDVSPRS